MAGIVSIYPNPHVEVLKGYLWSRLLRSLGTEGVDVLKQLFMDYSLFIPMQNGQGRYKQLSGWLIFGV